MTIKEKKLMIGKFIEVAIGRFSDGFCVECHPPQAIPVHQEAARRTSERFHELGKQVEVFPTKVASYLRQEADKQGFWSYFWVGVQE